MSIFTSKNAAEKILSKNDKGIKVFPPVSNRVKQLPIALMKKITSFSSSKYMTSAWRYRLVAVTSSGILKAKQKLGVPFNSNKLGVIDFTKFSKLTMCSA